MVAPARAPGSDLGACYNRVALELEARDQRILELAADLNLRSDQRDRCEAEILRLRAELDTAREDLHITRASFAAVCNAEERDDMLGDLMREDRPIPYVPTGKVP